MSTHITVGDVAPRVQYIASGTQTVFSFRFPIFAAVDLEVRIDGTVLSGGYTVAGAGKSDGGSVTFDTPPHAGARITLRRNLKIMRVTDFQDNSILRARALNDELDYQVAALQQLHDSTRRMIQLAPDDFSDPGQLPSDRAGQLLGFDATGRLSTYPASIPVPVPEAGRLNAGDFGAVGDGVTDDTEALRAACAMAAFQGRVLEIAEGTYRISDTVTLPGAAAGLLMRGVIQSDGGGYAALVLGDGGAVRNGEKIYSGLRVVRAAQSDWSDEADIGIVLRNLDASQVEIRQAEGYTIGVRTLGDGRGMQNSTLFLGRLVNNRIGLDVHTGTAQGWNNAVRYYGGHFAVASYVNRGMSRFGVRFSAEPGAYVLHNGHTFDTPNFELQADVTTEGIPFLIEVNSRGMQARGIRMEGCSPYVARHTAGAQDHVYDVSWASQGYLLDIDYAPGATRAGAVMRVLHQNAGYADCSRLVAAVPCLRDAAIRWSNTETGFRGLACLSTSVANGRVLSDFAFPALTGLALTGRGVTLGVARGIGFVVDVRACRDLALSVDGDPARLIVQCFDAQGNLMGDAASPLVRGSAQSFIWNATARWFQSTADMSDANWTRRPAVRIGASVATVIIGVARGDADAEIRALHLFTNAAGTPSLLHGSEAVTAGRDTFVAETTWDPPSIAAGGTAQVSVPLTGARPGDFVQVGFGLATSGVLFLAQVGATDIVTVTAWNRTGATLDLGPATLRVHLVKA